MDQYNEIINNYIEKFEKTLNENYSNKEELIKAFREYLESNVQADLEVDMGDQDRNEFVTEWLIKDAERIINMDIESKERKLFEDMSFFQLKHVSYFLYQKALSKIDDPIITMSEEEYKEYRRVLNEYYNNVKSFNKKEAKYLLSEALLDANYLFNPETNIMSIRLGIRFMNQRSSKTR